MAREVYVYLLFVIGFLFSCTNKPDLQVVRYSSELLQCEKIFSTDLNAIEERNEILIQTGEVDTTTESASFKAAIIYNSGKEIILKLEKNSASNSLTNELYTGDGWRLNLTYTTTKNRYGYFIYKGKFIIEHNHSKNEFDLAGRDCNL